MLNEDGDEHDVMVYLVEFGDDAKVSGQLAGFWTHEEAETALTSLYAKDNPSPLSSTMCRLAPISASGESTDDCEAASLNKIADDAERNGRLPEYVDELRRIAGTYTRRSSGVNHPGGRR